MRTWWFWSSHIALAYANFRGLDGMMYDFYDFPEKVHEIFAKLTNGYRKKLQFLEANRLLYQNTDNTFVGSGGLGLTDSLHTDPDHVIYPYHKQTAELFGLTCYACCEGIDEKWEWVKELPNLRRVSISQWSDMAKMSDYLKGELNRVY